jgi:glycosyltransferase involved in cell wall biosynthesis
VKIRVLQFAKVINHNDFIDTIIRFIGKSRFEVEACTLGDTANIEAPLYGEIDVVHHNLGEWSRARYPSVVIRLAQLLRARRVDILHVHHFEEAAVGVAAGMIAGTPAVVIGRHYEDEIDLLTTGMKRRVLLGLEAVCNRMARGVIVPSMQIRDRLVGHDGINREKVWFIPYGFDFAAQRYRPTSSQEIAGLRRSLGLEGRFVIGNVGRHHPLKGQRYLLDAAAMLAREFRELSVFLVGDGPEHNRLRAYAREIGIAERVVFAGWRRDVPELLEAMDVVVHPSLHEALPQVMVEALAKARPLVITNVSGASEHIRHMQTGILIAKRDAEAIRGAVAWVIRNRDEAKEMAERGREYVRSALDIRRVIDGYEACYGALAEQSLRRRRN